MADKPFAVITFPNYEGTITRKGLGRPAVEFFDLPEHAPILKEGHKWWDDWISVTVDGHWYGEAPKKKRAVDNGKSKSD